MRRRAAVGMVLLGLVPATAGDISSWARPPARSAPPASEVYGRLPLSFEPTAGGFSARGPGYAVQLQGDGARMLLGDVPVAMRLHGGRAEAEGEGREPLPGAVNHLTGSDAAGWRIDVPTYGKVTYAGVYDGIDVAWYGAGGNLEFDLLVTPGADPAQVVLGFDGADKVRLDAGGDLVVSVAGKQLVQRRPVTYQNSERGRQPVASEYVARGDDRYGVAVGDYDDTRPLVIDPVIVYSTLLGGTGADWAEDVAVDGSGHVYVVGSTYSADFPTAGALRPYGGEGVHAVVFKLNPAGTALVFSTYLAGGTGNAVAVDSSGAAYVVGTTFSRDFPLQAAAQGTLGGGGDAFVVKLSPSGSALSYGTYLGGSNLDEATGVAVDSAGNAHVSGTTRSSDFPTVQAFQGANRGASDAFVARLTPSGALASSTYLGGSGEDVGADIGVDTAGSAVVVGTTHSADFPIVQPAQAVLRGQSDAFVARLTAGGSALLFSTYLGGTGHSTDGHFPPEGAFAVAVDRSSNAYVTGYTPSTDFPTHNALFPTSDGWDTFLTKVAPSGALIFSTYLRTTEVSYPGDLDLAVDGGRVHVVGTTWGPVLQKEPLHPPRQFQDAFVTTLSADGSALLFSTNLGGDGFDAARGVAVDGSGAVYVVGNTHMNGPGEPFPTKNAVQPAPAGNGDMFITKIGGLQAAPTIAGSTWYADGTKTKAGPAGTPVTLYAVGALELVPYQLVLASGGNCATTVAVLNAATVQAGPSGLIGRVRGTIPVGTPPGTYDICFRHAGGTTATGVVGFVVQ